METHTKELCKERPNIDLEFIDMPTEISTKESGKTMSSRAMGYLNLQMVLCIKVNLAKANPRVRVCTNINHYNMMILSNTVVLG